MSDVSGRGIKKKPICTLMKYWYDDHQFRTLLKKEVSKTNTLTYVLSNSICTTCTWDVWSQKGWYQSFWAIDIFLVKYTVKSSPYYSLGYFLRTFYWMKHLKWWHISCLHQCNVLWKEAPSNTCNWKTILYCMYQCHPQS